MTKKELKAKLKVLEDKGIVSWIFLNTLGLGVIDSGLVTVGNGKKVKCHTNYYCAYCVPPSIQKYIDKGYMEQITEININNFKVFKVTEKGFAWLSKLLGIKVEEVK